MKLLYKKQIVFLIFLIGIVFFASYVFAAPDCECLAGGLPPDGPSCYAVPTEFGSGCPNGVVDNCGVPQPPDSFCLGTCSCVDLCTHPCVVGEKECTSSNAYKECVMGSNGCETWIGGYSCGTTLCPADSCTGVEVYIDYNLNCDKTCSGAGICSSCSCSPISSLTCYSGRSCLQDSCN